jgi:hypothetical protein
MPFFLPNRTPAAPKAYRPFNVLHINGRCLLVFFLYTLIDLFPMDHHSGRCFDPYPHLTSFDLQDRHNDTVAYCNPLADPPGQDQHPHPPWRFY